MYIDTCRYSKEGGNREAVAVVLSVGVRVVRTGVDVCVSACALRVGMRAKSRMEQTRVYLERSCAQIHLSRSLSLTRSVTRARSLCPPPSLLPQVETVQQLQQQVQQQSLAASLPPAVAQQQQAAVQAAAAAAPPLLVDGSAADTASLQAQAGQMVCLCVSVSLCVSVCDSLFHCCPLYSSSTLCCTRSVLPARARTHAHTQARIHKLNPFRVAKQSRVM